MVRVFPLSMCLLLPAMCSADEAVRRDGSRINGELAIIAGKFVFKADGKVVSISELDLVRFKPKPSPTLHVSLWHQVKLAHGQSILAEIRKVDATHLLVRPSWTTDVLAIPRPAIERIGHRPGWQPVVFDAFDRDLSQWTTGGEPRVEGGKLLLEKAGQSISTPIKPPFVSGQVVVGAEFAQTKSRSVHLELGFERQGKSANVRVELIGPGRHFQVASLLKPKVEQAIARSTRHSLVVEFGDSSVDVTVDGKVVWAATEGIGSLSSVRLVASGDGREAAIVHDILVARTIAKTDPQSWADLTADAIRSSEGDETFGRLVELTSDGLILEAKGRKQTLRWPAIGEFTFRRSAVEEKPTIGEHVQARIVNTDGGYDVLEGAVTEFDDKRLVLMHAILGKVVVPRNRLAELRFLFHGRRLPIDSTPRHLGSKPAFGFAVPKPEGLSFKKTVRLDTAATGMIVVDAAHVSEKGTPIEVLVNGVSLGELNRQADRADAAVRTYRLPLTAIAAGDVEIEIRLRPSKDRGRVNGIDLRGIRLELHDPR